MPSGDATLQKMLVKVQALLFYLAGTHLSEPLSMSSRHLHTQGKVKQGRTTLGLVPFASEEPGEQPPLQTWERWQKMNLPRAPC